MPAEPPREQLRQTFDRAAASYDRIRPDYPPELFADLVALTGLSPGEELIEVGCGTGKATRPLARRGFRITGVELGAALAAAARENLAGTGAEVVQADFETWSPPRPAALVYAATAWHWIDPAVRYERAWQALRPGGHLAFWSATHVFPDGGDPFFEQIQDIYDELGDPDPVRPRPGELPDDRAEIDATGLFEVTAVRQYAWEQVYGTEDYIALLGTFSGHLAWPQWKRDRLFTEIRRRLALRPGHAVRRGWGAVLHVARRRDAGGSLPAHRRPPVLRYAHADDGGGAVTADG